MTSNKNQNLQGAIEAYFPDHQGYDAEPFGSGHINDTYKIRLAGQSNSYILQRINTQVFGNPKGIIDTHLKLQEIIFRQHSRVSIAEIIPNHQGGYLTTDKDGNVWRLTGFIEDSYTIEVVEATWQAYEAGLAFGWFAKTFSHLDVKDFTEPIKDFHRLSYRMSQLHKAMAENKAGKLDSVKKVLDFFMERAEMLSKIECLVHEGRIPLRIVHNDTKINNLLFRGGKAVAVIDLDTTGPGTLFYDFGDAIRTIANTAKEDETNLSKVQFHIGNFGAFTRGYLSQVKYIITGLEKEFMYLAPVLMTFIMGIRFLTDHFNGNIYYKVAYPEHNLHRCLVQKKLIALMEEHEPEMKSIINSSINSD